MQLCHNYGPLFLVQAAQSYGECDRLVHTCVSFEDALAAAQGHMDSDRSGYDDVVRVVAVSPGPGPGVVVARFHPDRPSYEECCRCWPCDGEGPTLPEPETVWRRVL